MNALVPLHPLVTALQAHSTLEVSKWLELLYFDGGGAGFDSRRLHHFIDYIRCLRVQLRSSENPHPPRRNGTK